MIYPIRCPNASTEACSYPLCRCHAPAPAEAATYIGADTDEPTESDGERFIRALIVCLLAWFAVGMVSITVLAVSQ